MAKPNFTLPNKPAIKSGGILSYNYTDDFTFVPAPLTFNRDSAATRVNEKGLIEQVGYFGPELVQNGDFSELGSELVTNGNFDTDLNGWRAYSSTLISWESGGYAVVSNNNGYWCKIQKEGNVFEVGKIYKITMRAKSNLANRSFHGDIFTGQSFSEVDTFQTFTQYFKATITGFSVGFHDVSAFGEVTITIDNVSVKEVDPNNYWILHTGWSLGDGVAIANNSSSYIKQNNVVTNGKSYKVVFDTIVTSGQFRAVTTADPSTYTPYVNKSGTYTFYINPTSSINGGFEFIGNSFVGSIDNISVIEVLGDKPRIDYSDSLTEPSLLLEPQSTNVLENSEITSTWVYTEFGSGSAGTITTGKTDMFGGTNAVQVDFPADAENVSLTFGQTTSSISSGSATASVYIKLVESGSKTLQFRCSTGVISNVLVDTTDFVRYEATGTKSSYESFNVKLRPSSGTSSGGFSIIICQPQEEALSYSTSYIPTAGSTATRLGETAINAGDVNVFNSEEGVLYAEISVLNSSNIFDFGLYGNTSANQCRIGFFNDDVYATLYNGSFQTQMSAPNDLSDFTKIAFKFKENDFALWINGNEVANDTSGTTFNSGDLVKLNLSGQNGTSSLVTGKVRNLQVFNKALTDRELEILTIQ